MVDVVIKEDSAISWLPSCLEPSAAPRMRNDFPVLSVRPSVLGICQFKTATDNLKSDAPKLHSITFA